MRSPRHWPLIQFRCKSGPKKKKKIGLVPIRLASALSLNDEKTIYEDAQQQIHHTVRDAPICNELATMHGYKRRRRRQNLFVLKNITHKTYYYTLRTDERYTSNEEKVYLCTTRKVRATLKSFRICAKRSVHHHTRSHVAIYCIYTWTHQHEFTKV